MRDTARWALPLILLALTACSKPAPDAQPPAQADAAPEAPAQDSAATGAQFDPANFELTMDKVDRMIGAMRKVAELEKQDPALEDAVARDASESEDQFVARIEAHPAVRTAVTSTGLSVREFSRTGEALTAAMFAYGMVESGTIKELPEGINRQHVEFVKQHKDELAKKMQEG